MNDSPLRVALVGCGGMAQYYRTVYARLSGVRWQWAIDVDAAVLNACLQEGARHVSSHFDDCLSDDVDVVVISTPNHMHAAQAVAALDLGKDVLLQKPIANSIVAADRIVEAAARSTGTAGMYMSSYEDRIVWDVKRMITEGLLGRVQSVRAHDAHRGGLNAKPGQWRGSREQTGGGCCMQLSIHAINLLQWWLDKRIVSVTAMSDNRLCPNIGGDDVTSVSVAFEAGIYGVLQAAYASDGGTIREVHGTRGWVRIAIEQGLIEVQLDDAFRCESFNYDTPGKVRSFGFTRADFGDLNNPLNQHRMFIEALQTDRHQHMGVEVGRRDLQVVQAIYRSADERRTIDLDDEVALEHSGTAAASTNF